MARQTETLLGALFLDWLSGEPPAVVHPVVWMGRALGFLERVAPESRVPRLAFGVVVASTLPWVWGYSMSRIATRSPTCICGILLKSAFAGRSLLTAAESVEAELRQGDLQRARAALGSLVSRSTAELGEGLIAAAAIESLAENFVDSWIAPLLAYIVSGISGAYIYRTANTADAMWGYRTPRYEDLGKAAARLDDLLNIVPARLGSLFLLLSAGNTASARVIRARDHGLTASPNAGHPMALLAGALSVRLEKQGCYALNAGAREPTVDDLAAARKLVGRAMLLSSGIALFVLALQERVERTDRAGA